MNTGLKLWNKAKKIIPGGNSLLSKRPERYAPDIWPTYFSRAKGVQVWDLDGKKYIDMAQMGIGTCILGYADKDVNCAVGRAIAQGVNSTLNAPEEVELAQKLLGLNPFAGGVRFARTGGEAMTIAIRIARAASGKDKVAFSGYHGWCDWYLAANLTGEANLSEHLLPGLAPKGVPKGLTKTAFPFKYNSTDELAEILKSQDIGVIVFEGARYDFPQKSFLDYISKVSREKGIVVIVDEITSGWRMTDGGVYKLNKFTPDIVVYGKGMGNGFAISAILGKKKIMDEAQETFISSTFWTERVGFSAALSTIDKLKKVKAWEHLNSIGESIGKGWEDLAAKHGIKLHITSFKPLITFKFDYAQSNAALYTFFTQEMLKLGYLASNSVYVSYAHDQKIIKRYFEAVDKVFKLISKAISSNDILKRLNTAVRDDGFKRLT